MRAVFISYRRDDSDGQAGRLYDDLVRHFGEGAVFMDVARIKAGLDFREVIDENVASCSVLLALIGRGWIDAKDEMGHRRLDDPRDFVRLETASALKRNIPVIPVLVQGAKMPRPEQLPEDLHGLAYRNCVELTHTRWDSDVQVLIKALPWGSRRRVWFVALGAVMVLAVLLAASRLLPRHPRWDRQPASTSVPAQPPVPTTSPAKSTTQALQAREDKPVKDDKSAHERVVPAAEKEIQPPEKKLTSPRTPTPADSVEMERLKEQQDQLSSQVGSINDSLENLKKQQNASGFSLRGDIASARSLMNSHLAGAQSAIQKGDTQSAAKYLELLEGDVTTLDKFLGR